MLARAIIERPKLLLIDGTLDRLSDALLPDLLPELIGPKVPWTTVVATGRYAVIAACDQLLDLDRGEVRNPKFEVR
jgi:ABC-type bacteriocin/lantibiotic exporter with double-glycine peptidase domain